MNDPDFTLSAGPVTASARTLAALGSPITYHYDPAFLECFRRTERKVAQVLQTSADVVLMQGEAVLGLEAAARALVRPGTPVLNLVSGVFGKGMGYWLSDFGADLHEIEVAYNDAVGATEVERFLRSHPEIEVVAVVHSETPSGTLNPVAEIGPIARAHGALTLVDCVSSVGGIPFKADEWQLDVAVEPFEIEPLELDGELLAKARRGDRASARARQTVIEGRRAVRILAVGNGKRGHLELEPLRREVLERVITAADVDEIARDHRVHRKTPEVRARAAERAAGGLRIVRGLRDGVVKQELHDRRGNAVGCRHVPSAFARGEAQTEEQRMPTGGVHVRVDRERARAAQLGRDLVRIDIGDERGLDWRRDGGRRFEAELHLASARHE